MAHRARVQIPAVDLDIAVRAAHLKPALRARSGAFPSQARHRSVIGLRHAGATTGHPRRRGCALDRGHGHRAALTS